MNRRYSTLLSLLVIFTFGLLIRLYALGQIPPALYTDELNELLGAKIQLYGISSVPFSHISNRTAPATLFYAINGYFLGILIFGFNNFSARFPYALYSALMVFPLYSFSYELTRKRSVGILSSLLWIISPLSFVAARDADSVEILPLFLFLIVLFLLVKISRGRGRIWDYLVFLIILGISLFIPAIETWIIIPILIALALVICNFFLVTPKKGRLMNALKYIYFSTLIVSIFIIIFFPNVLFDTILKTLKAAQVSPSFYIFSEPFYRSIPYFFLRLFTFLSPAKMFLLSNPLNPEISLHYVLVPFMLPFMMFAFYPTVAFIVWQILVNRNRRLYVFLLMLFIAGYVQPIMNISNPISYLEPLEGLFALPFAIIISSIGILKFSGYAFRSAKNSKKDASRIRRFRNRHLSLRKYRRATFVVLIVIFIISGTVSTTTFVHTYFTGYRNSLESNNSSPDYNSFGIEQASQYIVSHGLMNEQIFFVPSDGGGVNFSNTGEFNYWVYYLHFPSAWFYLYTNGKVHSVNVLHPGNLPDLSGNESILISQNSSYGSLLSSAGFSYNLLYSLNRSNGEAAIRLYQIMPTTFTPRNVIYRVSNYTGFYNTNISLPTNYSFSATIFVKVLGKPTRTDLLFSHGYGLDVGVQYAESFPWLHLPNNSLVPYSNLYSQIKSGNYSTSYSWYQFADNFAFKKGDTFMITVTYQDGLYSTYINDSLIGRSTILYPVLLQNITVNVPPSYEVSVFLLNYPISQGHLYDLWYTLSHRSTS